MLEEGRFRVAAFDLDGTLLDMGQMHPEVSEALRDLRNSGINTVVATGRDWCQLTPEIREHFSYAVTCSGAYIRNCLKEEAIASHPIPSHTLLALIRIIDKYNGGYFLYEEGKAECTGNAFALINKEEPRMDRERFLEIFSTREHATHSLYKYEKETQALVYKVQSYFASDEITDACYKEITESMHLEVVRMGHCSIEINALGVTKALGLLELGKRIGFSSKNLVCFGDSANDYEMLKLAGFSVAMGNAEEKIKRMADYVAGDVKENGAANAIRELFGV